MPALSDRTFNPKAWARLGFVAVGLGVVGMLVWGSMILHERVIEAPRLLEQRHDDPPGRVGTASTRISRLGDQAVPTLLEDLKGGSPLKRAKSLELLSTIDDPRVVPALGAALQDKDITVKLAALSGLGRTGKPEAAKAIWPLTDRDDELVRLRAVAALGLVGGPDDAKLLLQKALEVTGHERYLMAWAAGHIERRQQSVQAGKKGYVAAAPMPQDDAAAAKLQADVDAVHAELDAGRDLAKNGLRLAELTDLSFSTWDFGHQITLQGMAVMGPRAVRLGGDAADEIKPPPPTQRKLQLADPQP